MQPMFSLLAVILTAYLHIKVRYLFWCTEVNLLHNYTNNAVADLCTHNFNDIQYYHPDSIHYHESGKI